jgi:protein-tyrosine-phosphatase
MNTVRSVMAAAMLRHLAGSRAYVRSAGVRAGHPDAFVTVVMDEIGIDVSQHSPNTLRDLHDTSFDLIVTLSPEAHHQALELMRSMAVDVEYWPTLDATRVAEHCSREQTLRCYREVRDQLFEKIRTRFGFEGGPTV